MGNDGGAIYRVTIRSYKCMGEVQVGVGIADEISCEHEYYQMK